MKIKDGISSTEDLLSNPSFRRWVNGTLNKSEAVRWDEWCRKSESNRRLAYRAQAEILGVKPAFSEKGNPADEWGKIISRIKEMQRAQLNTQLRHATALRGYRIAVAILVIACTGFLTLQWYGTDSISTDIPPDEIVQQTIQTNNGEQKRITLTDGSMIVLAANSRLEYTYGKDQVSGAEIKLKGEAYFSIEPVEDTGNSFNISTYDGTVIVTGTRFTVDTYDDRTRVVLEEGSVDIERSLNPNEEKQVTTLKPNQLAEFNRESISIKEVNTDIYTSWTRHELVLDNTPLQFLAEKISKTYGVTIKTDNPALLERRVTGTVNFRSLDRLLLAISEVLEIEVSQMGSNVIFEADLNQSTNTQTTMTN